MGKLLENLTHNAKASHTICLRVTWCVQGRIVLMYSRPVPIQKLIPLPSPPRYDIKILETDILLCSVTSRTVKRDDSKWKELYKVLTTLLTSCGLKETFKNFADTSFQQKERLDWKRRRYFSSWRIWIICFSCLHFLKIRDLWIDEPFPMKVKHEMAGKEKERCTDKNPAFGQSEDNRVITQNK